MGALVELFAIAAAGGTKCCQLLRTRNSAHSRSRPSQPHPRESLADDIGFNFRRELSRSVSRPAVQDEHSFACMKPSGPRQNFMSFAAAIISCLVYAFPDARALLAPLSCDLRNGEAAIHERERFVSTRKSRRSRTTASNTFWCMKCCIWSNRPTTRTSSH